MAVALGGIPVGVGLGGVVHLGARDHKNVKNAKTPKSATEKQDKQRREIRTLHKDCDAV